MAVDVGFEQESTTSNIRCQIRSERGAKVEIWGDVDDLEPTVVGHATLKLNVSLIHNAWAFARYEFQYLNRISSDERATAKSKADSHRKIIERLTGLIDRLGEKSREGWCSNCFERARHRKVESGNRTSTYLCELCGSPSTPCVAPHCDNMAARSLGAVQLPKFCAEHTHEIPSFERAKERFKTLEDYEAFLVYEKANLDRSARIALTGVLAAGLAFPLVNAAVPAIGGAVGVLASGSSFTGVGALYGGAAANYGLALLGGGSVAAGGLGVAGGTMVITAFGSSLGAALGASITNTYIRDDKSFRIEKFADGTGTPVIVAKGFTNEGSIRWRQEVEEIEKFYPDSPIYFLHWGSKELADLAMLFGHDVAAAAGRAGIGAAARKAAKSSVRKLGPLAPAVIAADAAKNPWHAALSRADKTGAALAGLLARVESTRFVLVGHSLGARVMATAIQSLSTSDDSPVIESAHLFGAAVGRSIDWNQLGQNVEAGVNIYHSERDKVLKYLYKSAQFGDTPVGLSGAKSTHPKVRDHDVTATVSGHSNYYGNVEWQVETP